MSTPLISIVMRSFNEAWALKETLPALAAQDYPNTELIVKVVDACSHPDFHDFWVYASGLTDVAVTLTVVDTWTGETWERETVLGEPFPPVLDSQAFHTCAALPALGSGALRRVAQ